MRSTIPHLAARLFIVAVWCAAPAAAAAQVDQGPARALFGQAPVTNRPVSLISASVFAGAGTGVAGDDIASNSLLGDYTTGVNGTLSHVRRGRSYTFDVGAGTQVWYYPERGRIQMIDRSVRVGLDRSMGRNTRVAVSQTLLYTPFRQFGGFTSTDAAGTFVPPTADPDSASAVAAPSYDIGTGVTLGHDFSRRVGLDVSYTGRWHYGVAYDDLSTHRGAVSLRVGLGRFAALMLGTGRGFGHSARQPDRRSVQEFDLGIDFQRPLSFSRTTTLSVTTGMALVSLAGDVDPLELGSRIRVIGNAALNKNLSRDWVVQGGYERNMRFIEGFPDPFYASAVSGRLTGQMGRRYAISLHADYSSGKTLDPTLTGGEQYFRGLQGQVRFTAAFSRWALFYVEQHYSENVLSAAALANLAPGVIPRRYARGLRLGLALWSPKVH